MRFDSDRRLANMLKRVYAQIDDAASAEKTIIAGLGKWAREDMHKRFNHAARSIGQSRRQRNLKGSRQ